MCSRASQRRRLLDVARRTLEPTARLGGVAGSGRGLVARRRRDDLIGRTGVGDGGGRGDGRRALAGLLRLLVLLALALLLGLLVLGLLDLVGHGGVAHR